MAMIEINWNPSRRELRQFAGIWFPAFFMLVGGLVWYHNGSMQLTAVIWGAALFVSVVGFFVPSFMRWIFVSWMVAAYPIGWLVSHVLLGIIYFLILTPIGLVMRLLAEDPMRRKFDRGAKTYWVPHNPGGNMKRYFRQF